MARFLTRTRAMLVAMAAVLCMTAGVFGALDRIILNSGKIIEGEIIQETATQVRVRVVVAGISGETTYSRSEIASIEHDVVAEEAGTPTQAPGLSGSRSDPSGASESNVKTVYRIELSGNFGQEISQSPLREAVRDAQRYAPDYLIIELDGAWNASILGGPDWLPAPNDIGLFDELFRAEEMEPIFTREIPAEWEKQPTVVFWVKNAMGGAAFMPLICSNIYMHPDAKIGGIGDIDELFNGVGDEVVREKQRSLRMGHARGMAIQGGYDTRLVKAMCQLHYILSYRLEGGKPVYLERMPQGPHEILLTDAGGDVMEQRARNMGNDVLTLDAQTARDLSVSKGTVSTFEDLIFQLGIARNHRVIDGRADSIMESWKKGVNSLERDITRMNKEVGEIKPQGNDARDRVRAMGQRVRKYEEMLALLSKYQEIDPGIPQFMSEIRIQIQRLRLQMLMER